MPRPRTGSIEKLPGGRVRVRATTHGRRKTLIMVDTELEAELVRAPLIAQLNADPTSFVEWTVATWGEDWLDERERTSAIRDIDSDRGRFDLYLKADPIGAIPLRRLTRGDVIHWLARVKATTSARTGKALSVQSRRNIVTVLRGLCTAAVDHGHLQVNPATQLKIAKERRTEEPWTWLLPEELGRLCAAVEGPERYLIAFAAGSGLRAGELCALRAADVHDDHVVVRYGGPVTEPTKTGKIRRVPLFGIAAQAWRAWSEALPSFMTKTKANRGTTNPLGLAFPGKRGAFRDPGHVLMWGTWKAAQKAAQLGRDLRWHDLRHTCASSLVSGLWGRVWSLGEVKEVLGHTDITTTQRYAHLAHSAIQQAARETPGFVHESSTVASRNTRELAAKYPESFRSRFGDLNPRPTVYETVELANISASLDPAWTQRGPIAAAAAAFLLAAASGADPTEALSTLRSVCVEAHRQIEAELYGPHAVAAATRLASAVLGALGGEVAGTSARKGGGA